jgi:hypothetical protein
MSTFENNYQFAAIILVLILIVVVMLLAIEKLYKAILKVRIQIAQSIVPKFIDLSPSTNNIVDLGVEVWRLQKRLEKLGSSISEDQTKALQNSYAKLMRYLERNDIGITDYTDQKYNEGMNLDVLAVEKGSNVKQSIIKETHEPAITHKGQLIRKAKVIILEP